jgi:hypothetical protein
LKSDSTLHVIGVISNTARWNSRFRLYREWEKAMQGTENVALYTVETAYGDRHHEVTSPDNPHHLQLKSNEEIWLKENMINLGVKHLLPRNWKYVAWVDCDVFFRDPNWATNAIHALQHYHLIQPWMSAVNLGHAGQITSSFDSVGWKLYKGIDSSKLYTGDPAIIGHCGYAWACTREFYEGVEGLLDFAILGSGDHNMCLAARGIVKKSINMQMGEAFVRKCMEWERRAMRFTAGNIGYSAGRIEHKFHGAMKNRQYKERWRILVDRGFDPEKDLVRDSQGLWRLEGKPALHYDILRYNRSRNEDSIDEG